MNIEHNLRLVHILVPDESYFGWHEYLTKAEFTHYLRIHSPLINFRLTRIVYRSGKNLILQFDIKSASGLTAGFDVYNMDELFFSFNCSKGEDFMKIFEKRLKEELPKLDQNTLHGHNLDPNILKAGFI